MTGYLRNGSEPNPHGNKQPFCHQQRLRGQGRDRDDRRQQPAPAAPAVGGGRAARHDQARQRGTRGRPRARSRRSSPTSSRPGPPTSGRSSSRRAMCRRRGYGRWPRRSPTRISPRAACSTISPRPPASTARSACRWPAFNFAHGGPSIETPPPEIGADTDAVLAEFGYEADEIAEFRRAGVV